MKIYEALSGLMGRTLRGVCSLRCVTGRHQHRGQLAPPPATSGTRGLLACGHPFPCELMVFSRLLILFYILKAWDFSLPEIFHLCLTSFRLYFFRCFLLFVLMF